MSLRAPATRHAVYGVALAFALWAIIFGLKLINFWLGLSIAASLLAGLSIYWGGGLPLTRKEITHKNTALGILCAAVLYGIFALGRYISLHVLPFADTQIDSIYTIQQQGTPLAIALVLVCITSPSEEIFWRGFLQRWSMQRFGKMNGWLLATLCYAGVHVASLNFMLTGAALVAGLFWGFVYKHTGSLYVCIVSHAAWTVSIFLLWPLQ